MRQRNRAECQQYREQLSWEPVWYVRVYSRASYIAYDLSRPGFGDSSEDLLIAKIISWLTTFSVDYFPTYEEARSQRAPDTGKWLFDTTTYRTWVSTWGTKYRNLECVGIRA